MKSRTTAKFWRLFRRLPPDAQRRAYRAYDLWRDHSSAKGLNFKRVDPNEPLYSVRIGLDYRALGLVEGDTIFWFWIGHHDEYDRILS